MLTLVKLGGSLLTDKKQAKTLRADVLEQIADELQAALSERPQAVIVGHGSGSFGHVEAKQYDTINGVETADQWRGFAKVATVAAELNYHVARALAERDLPVMRFQPSASALANDGQVESMALEPIQAALDHGVLPLVYGDVGFDRIRGGTILSTETIFTYLTRNLPVTKILLCGEVDGVYDHDGKVIEHIMLETFGSVKTALGGSGGVDVTGGMLQKVVDALDLATHPPYPDVWILNGLVRGRLQAALRGDDVIGTRISR